MASYPDVRVCGGWESWLASAECFSAVVGVDCDYYSESCPPRQHCWPMAEMPLRELQVPAGGTVQTNLYFAIFPHSWEGCPVSCQGTEPWMLVEPVRAGERSWYTVSLTANAEGLSPGMHLGWVQVDSGNSRACTEIELEVLDVTGVPPPDHGISWGRVKSLY
ncbi:MAG: hypothetical protein R3C71_10375 [Candidatus Krumholzibacteriia bacterium]|nr:hypothetical protein [bacterium]